VIIDLTGDEPVASLRPMSSEVSVVRPVPQPSDQMGRQGVLPQSTPPLLETVNAVPLQSTSQLESSVVDSKQCDQMIIVQGRDSSPENKAARVSGPPDSTEASVSEQNRNESSSGRVRSPLPHTQIGIHYVFSVELMRLVGLPMMWDLLLRAWLRLTTSED
jgi:hypothetical protein